MEENAYTYMNVEENFFIDIHNFSLILFFFFLLSAITISNTNTRGSIVVDRLRQSTYSVASGKDRREASCCGAFGTVYWVWSSSGNKKTGKRPL